jgi:hypothetical protein
MFPSGDFFVCVIAERRNSAPRTPGIMADLDAARQ